MELKLLDDLGSTNGVSEMNNYLIKNLDKKTQWDKTCQGKKSIIVHLTHLMKSTSLNQNQGGLISISFSSVTL